MLSYERVFIPALYRYWGPAIASANRDSPDEDGSTNSTFPSSEDSVGNSDGSDGARQIVVRNSNNARDQAHLASESSKSDKGEQSGSAKAEGGAQNITTDSPSPNTLGDEFDLSNISEGDSFKQPASFEENMNVQDAIDQMQEQNIINY